MTNKKWCRTLFDKLKDGGLWAIPRSGMVFCKAEKARTLVWVATYPPEHVTEAPREMQLAELAGVTANFEAAGIGISLVAPVEDYPDFETAKAALEQRIMMRLREN